MKNKVNSFISFINYSIWYCDTATMPWWKKYLIYALKAVILLVRNFNSSKSHLWASALTYYSILSIVPILAIGFAIAHGFGLGQEMAT
ncbi:MAG: YihY/virulence factor BrkB family protein, partial [Victivallaceae bacterium]